MIEVRPLTEHGIGAEIVGADLSRPIDDATLGDIERAWLAHQVIVFRGQALSTEAQRDFAMRFGPLETVRTKPDNVGFPEVAYVSNVPFDGKPGILPEGEMQFHADQCYYERPCKASMLYAIAVPSTGGDTLFADAYGAYAALDEATRRRIAGLNALNAYDYDRNATLRGASRADAPRHVHPVVTVHPETGRPALFVNRLMTEHIEGLDRAESDALLETLFRAIEAPERIFRHSWRPGDLVMWDNRCTFHARTDFDPREQRTLRRVTVQGARPVGLSAAPAAE